MQKFFNSYKTPVSFFLVLILLSGAFVYDKMQVSLFPEITFPKIKIIADAGLQPVDKMMVTVTKPLENAVKMVPDIKLVRSTTSRGTCEIAAYLNEGADVDISLQKIESSINEIKNDLPAGVGIKTEKMNPSILTCYGICFAGKWIAFYRVETACSIHHKAFAVKGSRALPRSE